MKHRSLALLLVTSFVFSNCSLMPQPQPTPPDNSQNQPPEDISNPLVIEPDTQFAEYKEVNIEYEAQIPTYSIKDDLSNVTNINNEMLYVPDGAKPLLSKNGFAVYPSWTNEFFSLYEDNRYDFLPSFITTDSILHNYHVLFDYLLKKLEEEQLSVVLKQLNEKMLDATMEQYNALKGTDWENAARRNLGFFSVGTVLLDPESTPSEVVMHEVDEEMDLILDHEGIELSPVMNMGITNPDPLQDLKEDYSQYIPRGHYTKSELLKSYFKAMMWYGRMTFRFKNEDEIKSGLLITLALQDNKTLKLWKQIYEPTAFLVGKSDDISYYQFASITEQVYGENPTPKDVTDETKFAEFVKLAKKLEPPQINSMPIFDSDIQPDREKEIAGFRFMGQRFTIDASVFQRLVDREVPDRMLPKGLDITAAFGSEEALTLLEEMGETQYENYSDNMNKMREYIDGLDLKTWGQNVYFAWMYALKPLTEPKGEGYPLFMQNTAWTRKSLSTFLGNWTELKHDTILYAKQVYAEMGGMFEEPADIDDRGYVEPNPEVYARLASLTRLTLDGLDARGILSDDDKTSLELMEEITLKLKTISEKELNNESLTDDEYEFIRSYGGQIEHFWIEANKKDMEKAGMAQDTYLSQNPAAIVADVATDPNGQVLEEATGYIHTILVVVPIDGTLRIAKGGVFSYYEFPWPLDDRLTDEKWRDLLGSEEAPAQPEWTKMYVTEN